MQPNPTETRVVTPTDETTSSLKRYQAASSSQTPSGPPNTVMHSLPQNFTSEAIASDSDSSMDSYNFSD